MNRQQLRTPTGIDELAAQRAVFNLLEIAGKGVDIRQVVRDCVSHLCRCDANGRVDVEAKLLALHGITNELESASFAIWSDYSDARMELDDKPEARKALTSGGAGHSERETIPPCASLAALPPSVVAHLVRGPKAADRRALDRMRADGDGELADMLAQAAGVPLAILGNGEYANEIGGEG